MLFDKQFSEFLHDMEQHFSGWDFSYIAATGRVQEEMLPWSYGSMAKILVRQADTILDMGTGGGEFLSLLQPFPREIFATEGYEPNVEVAKHKLEPLGVKVVPVTNDANLPFENDKFDLILNQHESYFPKEVRRIIAKKGVFLTQQVGGLNCSGINEQLGVPINGEFVRWNLATAKKELLEYDFKIEFSKEDYPVQRFFDVGALVYYLKAIPW